MELWAINSRYVIRSGDLGTDVFEVNLGATRACYRISHVSDITIFAKYCLSVDGKTTGALHRRVCLRLTVRLCDPRTFEMSNCSSSFFDRDFMSAGPTRLGNKI